MREQINHLLAVAILTCLGFSALAEPAKSGPGETTAQPVVPWPRELKAGEGTLELSPSARISLGDKRLLAVANALAEDLETIANWKPPVIVGRARAGDIRLELDPRLNTEGHSLRIAQGVRITGKEAAAVAAAGASWLQLVTPHGQTVSSPRLTIRDQPFAEFRGLMVDVARQPHTITTLKKLVVLCHWYKLKYLQLHLADDQSFTFPSTAFPQLATPKRHFSLEELRELEAFASARGVVVLPELEMPGHASAFIGAMPELACEPRGSTLCPGRVETTRALDTLIGELCEAFQASPYIHIGADEVGKDAWAKCKHCQARMAEAGLANPEELYRDFLVRMDAAVKKHGRKTIVWEGFARTGKIAIPHDITVMVFESLYNRPDDLVQDGYKIINSAWQPLYVVNGRKWEPKYIYGWNLYRWENWWDKSQAFPKGINVPPSPLVLGAQMCAWEQSDATELPSLRQRAAALSERIWNPGAGQDWQNFSNRLAQADVRLTALLDVVK